MSTSKGLLAALPLLLALFGCVDSPQFLAKREQIEQTRPICAKGADCDAKWEAARHWVFNHAGFNVQTANNELIDTYFGGDSDERPVIRVTKEPIGGDKFKIVVSIRCTNFFGCVPNQWNEALAFNQAIGAVTP